MLLVIVINVLELCLTLRLVLYAHLGYLVMSQSRYRSPIIRSDNIIGLELYLHRTPYSRHPQMQDLPATPLLQNRFRQPLEVYFEISKNQLTPEYIVGRNTNVVAFLAKPIS